MRKIFSFLFVATTALLFQNCSNQGSIISDSSVSQASSGTPTAAGDSAQAQSQDLDVSNPLSPTSTLSAQECFLNYVSVFPWENSDQDAMEVPPLLGSTKIGTAKVFNSDQNTVESLQMSLSYLPNSAWRYYFLRTVKVDGSSSLTAFANKIDENDASTELTCYFGPFIDATGGSCNVTDSKAKMVYQNVGVGLNSVDGQAGYLSCSAKFIACKVTKGTKNVVIHTSSGNPITANAFVLKRGCYQ